jgi:hypothetical protein
MVYKKCGFRDRVRVCAFRDEDCLPDKCDMYFLDFAPQAIRERMREEAEKITVIGSNMMAYRKNKDTQNEEYKKLEAQLRDKVIGSDKLTKAYVYLKRCGK